MLTCIGPATCRLRRRMVEHPFGAINPWMGSTHFQMKTLKNVSTEWRCTFWLTT